MGSYRLGAEYYDAIYADKDYAGPVRELLAKLPPLQSALDVACGTGRHLEHLQKQIPHCEGLDLEPGLLDVARRRLPGLTFHEGDMREFRLPGRFDLITCWFGSIGYARDLDGLARCVKTWKAHLNPGGWIVIEPWLFPETFREGARYVRNVSTDEYDLTRMVVSHADGTLYSSDFHYLLATSSRGVEHFVERHELRMFTRAEYRQALEDEGLDLHTTEPLFIGRLS